MTHKVILNERQAVKANRGLFLRGKMLTPECTAEHVFKHLWAGVLAHCSKDKVGHCAFSNQVLCHIHLKVNMFVNVSQITILEFIIVSILPVFNA